MNEYGIVVRHIGIDEVTKRHIELLQKYNPNVPIETISGNIPFKNGLAAKKLRDFDNIWQRVAINSNKAWQNCDLLNYIWYRNKKNICKKWVLLEADVVCNINLKEFWEHHWNDPFVVAGKVRTVNDVEDWYWLRFYKTLSDTYKLHFSAITPFAVILIDDILLKKMVSLFEQEFIDSFCEIRFPTLANRAGILPIGFQDYKGYIDYKKLPFYTDITKEGLWHPVKNLT